MSTSGTQTAQAIQSVSAAASGLTKVLEDFSNGIAETAKSLGELTASVGEVGDVIQSGLMASLGASEQLTKRVANQMERTKLITLNFGAAVGDTLTPHLKAFNDELHRLFSAFMRLDPKVREAIGGFLFYGTAVGIAANATTKALGIVQTLAGLFNQTVVPAVGKASEGLKAFGTASRNNLPSVLDAFRRLASGVGTSIGQMSNVLPNAFRSAWPAVVGWLRAMPAAATGVIASLAAMGSGALTALRSVPGALVGVFAALRGAPAAAAGGLRSLGVFARVALGSLAGMATGAITALRGLPALLVRVGAGAGPALRMLVTGAGTAALSVGGLLARVLSVAVMAPVALGQMALASVASLGQVALAALVAAAPFLAAGAAIAALVLLAGTLYHAWNDSSTGFKEAALSVWDSLQAVAGKVADFFVNLFSGISNFVMGAVRSVMDAVAGMISGLATRAAPLADMLGLDGVAAKLRALQGLTGEGILAGLKGQLDSLKGELAPVWEGIKYGADYAWTGVKMMANDTTEAIKARINALLNGKPAALREPGEGKGTIEVGRPDTTPRPVRQFESLAHLAPKMPELSLEDFQAELAAAARKAMQAARAKLESRIVGDVTGAFEGLGNIINRAMEASAAGPAAAAASVVADLLMQSQTFKTLVEMVNTFLQSIADTLGTVLAPILPVIASVFDVVATLLRALQPVLDMLLAPLQAIAPLIQLIGMLFQGLAPVIGILGQIFLALAQPLTLLAGPVMKVFFEAIRFVAIGILYIVKGIGTVWNGLVGFVQSVFKALGKLPLVGGVFKDMARGMEKMKVPMDKVDGAINQLRETSYDAAAANAAQSVATWQNTEATQEASESVSNVPQGFKIALARFDAQNALPVAASASPVVASPAPAAAGGGGSVVIQSLVIEETSDPSETARSVIAEMKAESRRRRGNGEWMSSRY